MDSHAIALLATVEMRPEPLVARQEAAPVVRRLQFLVAPARHEGRGPQGQVRRAAPLHELADYPQRVGR